MKIAIVGPSPVPFTIGGAENFLWGLCEAINRETEHQADLIKLPSREFTFWDLIETYYDFYRLNLDQFDLVISTKYPSWMVRHRNCICYMLHTLRGLYDTYYLTHLPCKVDRKNVHINKILDYMEHHKKMSDLERFFQMIFALKEKNIPDSYYKFPGEFIRAVVHYLDAAALSQNGMKHIFAISETVKNRKEYYPPNAFVDVIYPPASFKERKIGGMKYIFTASRLDTPKRMDLLIRAMKYVHGDIQLFIAGNGPCKSDWEKLAANDQRIHFLGFVDEETLEDYYADSMVVPFFPYDEDYGLITIEAMLHKKPVITTVDAGGPTEFVIDGETGFVVKTNEKAIAEKINYFIENPKEAQRMGENAYQKVKGITWKSVVEKLLDKVLPDDNHLDFPTIKTKPTHDEKITVVSTFPIYPPQGGGQARIYNLYRHLANYYDITIVSLTNCDQKKYEGYIARNLKEIRIPKSKKHQELEWEIEKKAHFPISDIAVITLYNYTSEYVQKIKASIAESSLVIISHPYSYYAAKKYLNDCPFIYEAHNIESTMKENMLPNSSIKKELIENVYRIENECCKNSKWILTCSGDDQIALNKKYHIPIEKMIEIPNGVDCEDIKFTSIDERIGNKKRLGLDKNLIAVFMGSWHQPNLEAGEAIVKIAEKCPGIIFLLMGSQCEYFRKRKLPQNVGLLGVVDDAVKETVFKSADFALNPMQSGSGTNLKMFDYMASGIPVITTAFGTRGIVQKEHFIISEIDNMADVINNFSLTNCQEKVKSAREYVAQCFDWKVISGLLHNKLQRGFENGFY